MPTFYTILTDVGQAKLANAVALGQTINITELALGDGGGALPTPETDRTALVNEVRRAPINSSIVDPENPSWIVVEQVLPPEVGGWTIREIGIFDADGDLVGYGNYPETYKPVLSEGSSRTQTVRFVMEVSETAAVTLKVDPSVVLATRNYADNIVSEHASRTEGVHGIPPGESAIHTGSRPTTNIDTVNTTGFYICGSSTLGTAPPDGIIGTLLHIERGSSNQSTQIFDTLRSSGQDQALYTRTRDNSGAWTAWAAFSIGGGTAGGDTGVFDFLAAGDGTADANSIPGDPPHWLEVSNNPGDGAAGNQLFRMNSYGDVAYGNNIHSCRYYGDETTPTAIQNGAFLMSWGFRGFDGTALGSSSGAFQCKATEDFAPGAHGTKFQFEVTPNGSTARSKIVEITDSGVGIGVDVEPTWNDNYRVLEIGSKGTAVRSHKSQAEIALHSNAYYDPVGFKYGLSGTAGLIQMDINSDTFFKSAPSGAAGAAVTFKTNMVIKQDGDVLVGTESAQSSHVVQRTVASDVGNKVLTIGNGTAASVFYAVSSGGANTANASLRINKDGTTGRSINAAGTVNASGADYAEYMRKSPSCGEVAKGDVVGINASGELTDRFSEAVSFAIKSTDPSYVGGDIWGSELALGISEPIQPVLESDDLISARESAESQAMADLNATRESIFQQSLDDDATAVELQVALDTYNQAIADALAAFNSSMDIRAAQHGTDMAQYEFDLTNYREALEAERKHLDRVAFSGRVPVNYAGAVSGDYLVPVDDGVGGITVQALKSPDFEQYMRAVGKVVNVEDDGRPTVVVKVV